MPCIQSIADAKASFASRVNDGIVTLMACGYSRERATNSLLRELNRGESCTRPSDEEIFVAMKAYNLGIEEATKAIIVSKAMNRALAAASTPTKAIELLSEKISVANLLYDSSDEEIPSDDERSIRPELRVEPVIPVDRQLSSRRRTTSSRRSRVANKTLRPRINKPNMAGRKRSIEDTVSVEKKETRERSDSVTEVVNAKVNATKSNEEGCGAESLLRSPVVRAKRGLRVDDPETQTSSHKRIRSSES